MKCLHIEPLPSLEELRGLGKDAALLPSLGDEVGKLRRRSLPGREVVLRGGAPWGFSVEGGDDFSSMLAVSQVLYFAWNMLFVTPPPLHFKSVPTQTIKWPLKNNNNNSINRPTQIFSDPSIHNPSNETMSPKSCMMIQRVQSMYRSIESDIHCQADRSPSGRLQVVTKLTHVCYFVEWVVFNYCSVLNVNLGM